ncbi:MAG: hypothetical protein GWP61_01945 [Chloroflexi bacterium]|jgi:hypothetical protein|nr:hypothetical protein [Chloroflexota bacterium]
MTFIFAAVIVFLTFIIGALLAWAFKGFDKAVVKTRENVENQDRAYNPALTMGYRINSKASAEEQIKEARRVAARQAADLPRGANAKIGWREGAGLTTASKGLDQDPWTASKIAQFHDWDGAKVGIPAGGVPAGGVAVAAAAAPVATGKIKLVPGKDYPVIEITDGMSAEEKRKARIANSKAKSAAMKKAKAAGVTAAPAAAPIATAPGAPAAAPVAVGIEAPKLVAITDDMPADEKRKARIANSKAKSAFNKQLKAAGIDPKTVEIDDQGNVVLPQATVAPVAAPSQTATAAAVAPAAGPVDLAALGITAPQLVEITDDMLADEIRKARIGNSKAKSAFNKQLKAAGIDPKSVKIDDSGHAVMAEGATQAAAAPAAAPVQAAAEPVPAAPATAESGTVDLTALGISPPELVEISDEMSPDEKRQARIANSKAKSAFNKALKAAGVDPKSVKL